MAYVWITLDAPGYADALVQLSSVVGKYLSARARRDKRLGRLGLAGAIAIATFMAFRLGGGSAISKRSPVQDPETALALRAYQICAGAKSQSLCLSSRSGAPREVMREGRSVGAVCDFWSLHWSWRRCPAPAPGRRQATSCNTRRVLARRQPCAPAGQIQISKTQQAPTPISQKGGEPAVVIDERAPAPACGNVVAQRFLNRLGEEFSVRALSSLCTVSKRDVDCPTEYLPRYERVYLHLTYVHRQELVKLTLEAFQRLPSGAVRNGAAALTLSDEKRLSNLFGQLSEASECSEKK